MQEANDFGAGGGFCQSPWTNPITSSYSNGAGCPDYANCPDAMGTFTQGETFTIMWLARNHAESDQTPGNIYLYMSPVEDPNAGADVSVSTMKSTLLCQAPYMSCNGSNGNFVSCWTECTMPVNAAVGLHTLWWEWIWNNHPDIYTTCADINVVAGSSSSKSSSSSSSSGKPASTSTSTSGKVSSTSSPSKTSTSTTGKPSSSSSSTSGKGSSTSTSGKPASTSTSTTAKASTSTSGQSSSSSSSSSSGSSTSCQIGNMKCLTSETYSTCAHNLWGPSQSCQHGTVCSPSGNYIYCK